MEIFLIVLTIFLTQYILFREIKKGLVCQKISNINQRDMYETLVNLKTRIDQSILTAPKDSQDATKPIKPNNWDSMREAFKGPVRIDINERN